MNPSRHSPARLPIPKPSHTNPSSPATAPNPLKRSRPSSNIDTSALPHPASSDGGDKEDGPGDRRRWTLMHDLYARSDRILGAFLEDPRAWRRTRLAAQTQPTPGQTTTQPGTAARIQPKSSARTVDEDDYGDEDDDDDDFPPDPPPPQHHIPSPVPSPPRSQSALNGTATGPDKDKQSKEQQVKSAEDASKQLEAEKKADELHAKQSFHDLFFTLENDHDAMLEQSQLDELDRQVEAETAGEADEGEVAEPTSAPQQGTLSSAGLGAASLALRHLITKIDKNRHLIPATDEQLKKLLSDVRKNRSKWASEENVNQEELYEPAEHVLNELKGMTDYSTPFLKAVSVRDAPGYKDLIKHPMDLGSMIKKLKALTYKSKKEFCDDLELIWANCLKYNAAPEHPLRRKAEHMRKETGRLTTLIPDVTVRSRAEVEAEERRLHPEFDDGEESEDEPLMSTRGRKAPAKSSKGSGMATSRKAPTTTKDGTSTPIPEAKPPSLSQGPISALSHLKKEHLRSEAPSTDGSQRGTATPPPGDQTPAGQASSEADAAEPSINGAAPSQEDEPEDEDEEFRTWKQVTKKDRARVAQERHRLFSAHKVNLDEPALLRSKATMRRFQLQTLAGSVTGSQYTDRPTRPTHEAAQSSTLAEGMDQDDDNTLPDYYLPNSLVPAVDERLQWSTDAEGQIVDQKPDCLRALPNDVFHAPKSKLNDLVGSNMRQMQETRHATHRIGVVKQMTVQSQTYATQFQKHHIVPLAYPNIEPSVVSVDGPIMDTQLCRAVLQRTIGKMFYHAGFEEFQPTALEAVTDLTSHYLTDLVSTLGVYRETAQIAQTVPLGVQQQFGVKTDLRPRFTDEEAVLHTLQASGHDINDLEAYVDDDLKRQNSRLVAHHKSTEEYLKELLRPAFQKDDARGEGINFKDGSDNFVGGNFAEDIDEDFFGFRELGLDREFGIAGLSVPLHLLQSRLYDSSQPATAAAASGDGDVMPEPPKYDPITIENVGQQIGLVQDFFRKRLEENDDEPLIEDDDLPLKQRYPKPRLPPTGKISSPRKRPIREQQQMARKKRRLEIEAERQREKDKEAGPSEIANGASEAPQVNGLGISGSDDAAGTGSPIASHANVHPSSALATSSAYGTKDQNGDIPMVNGDNSSLPVTADADGDDDGPQNDLDALFEDGDKPLTPKSIQRLKLDAPSKASKGGDPEKKGHQANGTTSRAGTPQRQDSRQSAQDAEGDAEGDEEDEQDGQTGMLSPESMPIAAH